MCAFGRDYGRFVTGSVSIGFYCEIYYEPKDLFDEIKAHINLAGDSLSEDDTVIVEEEFSYSEWAKRPATANRSGAGDSETPVRINSFGDSDPR